MSKNFTYEKDGQKISRLKLVGEKVTFLSSSKDKQQENDAR